MGLSSWLRAKTLQWLQGPQQPEPRRPRKGAFVYTEHSGSYCEVIAVLKAATQPLTWEEVTARRRQPTTQTTRAILLQLVKEGKAVTSPQQHTGKGPAKLLYRWVA